MEKARIFISYKRKNKDQVFSIVEKIETQLGVKCWVDLDGIESSVQFASKICKAIDTAEVVLFMHSSIHLDIDFENDWTIKELNYAHAKKKRVVLVKLDNAPLDNIFLMEYGSKNNIDSRDETQFQKLLKDLNKWLNVSPKVQESNSKTTHTLNKEQESSSNIQTSLSKEKKLHEETTINANNHATSNYTNSNKNIVGRELLKILDSLAKKKLESDNKQTIYFPNGDRFEGKYENGKYHYGTFYYANGDKYEGEFENEKKHGRGIFYFANGGRYEGQFVDGKLHGKGTFYMSNGCKYEGEYAKGIRSGQGIFYYTNGDRYEGLFSIGKRHGRGILYYANGERYEGQWKDNKQHGQGTHYYADGTQQTVTYKNGELIETPSKKSWKFW
ncbi:MAG: TIR domain-containing protein [Bacteroidaceae bacterium]|nr:TIR domain-containing protein [Bacteroidaceae bacterium]